MDRVISSRMLFCGATLIVVVFFTSVLAATAQVLPVIELSEESDAFSPVSYGNKDYYVIPPMESHSGVIYTGPVTEAQYTSTRTEDLRTYQTNIYDGSPISSILTSGDYRSSSHPLFDDEQYPRAVSIDSGITTTTTSMPTTTTTTTTTTTSTTTADNVLTKFQKVPISLHTDYSFTFLAEGGTAYFGFYESSNPFYLDVHVRDCDSSGLISFGAANPGYFSITLKKNTFPVFPTEGEVQNFTLYLTRTTLVTLTPHKMTLPAPLATIKVNESFSGEIMQGSLFGEEDGSMVCPDNDIASIRLFSMSELVTGEYYRIYMYVEDRCYNCEEIESTYYTLPIFLSGNYDIISGSLDENGVLIRANADEVLQLALYSVGVVQQAYTIYFRNILPSETETTVEQQLVLNEDVELEENTFYNFTFTNPVMMALNRTGFYSINFYIEDNDVNGWKIKPLSFNIEDGRLYGDYNGDLGINWWYIPAGTYAIKVSDKNEGAEIRFNTITVMKPSSSSLQLLVNENSLFAIEIPVMKNRVNLVNFSTTDTIDQSVNYEYSFCGKYGEFIQSSDSCYLSNVDNNVLVYWDVVTRTNEIPILLVRPYAASNDTFSASLTVHMTAPSDYYPYISKNYMGDGYFIPLNTISTTTTFTVNDDYSVDNTHIYGIPMSLTEYNLYNITVTLDGDNTYIYSSFAHGANLRDIKVFNSYDSGSNGSDHHWTKFLMLSITNSAFLYVNIERSGDATCRVSIERLPVTNLNFTVPELSGYEWVSTRLDGEKKNTAKAADFTQVAGKTPGFEIPVVIATLVVISVVIRNKRKQQ